MKILHTADWHIGRKLNGLDLLDEQRFVLDQLVRDIKSEGPDVVVISGDIFDRTNPSKEALDVVNEYLYTINIELKVTVLVISGNHDSKERLNYGSAWFKKSGLYIGTALEDAFDPVEMGDHHFYLLPHVDVLEVKHFYDDPDIRTHHDAYDRIVSDIKENMNHDKKNVLTGHLFITDASASESERPLSIGLSEEVQKGVFECFDYVLLGHLHHPFAITDDRVFYSGSLLKYSFSEINQPKGYRLLDTETGTTEFKRLYPQHDLVHFDGDYHALINREVMFEDEESYFKFELANMTYVKEPMSKLKQIYPNTLELKPKIEHIDNEMTSVDINRTSDLEIFESFIRNMSGEQATDYDRTVFKENFAGEDNETE